MLTSSVKAIVLLILSLHLTACYGYRGGDSMPFIGEMEVYLDDENKLCLKPLFGTIRYPIDDKKTIKYLNMERININNGAKKTINYENLLITPKRKKYYRVYDNDEICMSYANKDFIKQGYIDRRNQEIYLIMSGRTDDEMYELYFTGHIIY